MMMMTGMTGIDPEQIREALVADRKKQYGEISPDDLLGTGSTLLNLACTGNVRGGFPRGCYILLAGDSVSGKTWVAMSCLAEASINPHFKDDRIILDSVEGGSLMDVERYFGTAMVGRLEPPRWEEDDGAVFSETAEDFFIHVDNAARAGRSFIYVLDSMDSLTTSVDLDRFDERKEARRKGESTSGDYGDGKASVNSRWMRLSIANLRDTRSILVVISQMRDNLGFGAPQKPSGGRALKFYATLEIWTKRVKKITRDVKGKSRTIGILVKFDVRKNRLTGREVAVEVPIYHSVGIDDVGSCVDYLLSEKHWKQEGRKILAKELGFSGTREKLIQHIEVEDLEERLRAVVQEVWDEIDEATRLERKPRYPREVDCAGTDQKEE
jgi:RecA/RadA recombinase